MLMAMVHLLQPLLGSFMEPIHKAVASETERKAAYESGGDYFSKTGRTFDDTANRIRSGMLGITEAIRRFRCLYTQVSMLESTEAFKKFRKRKIMGAVRF